LISEEKVIDDWRLIEQIIRKFVKDKMGTKLIEIGDKIWFF
jgi:hypothetical protein